MFVLRGTNKLFLPGGQIKCDGVTDWWTDPQSALYLLICLNFQSHLLLLPFIFHTFVDLILFISFGAFLSASFFYLGLVPGTMATITLVISTTIFLYLWRVVLASYQDISTKDRQGSSYDKNTFVPSAPQQFQVTERWGNKNVVKTSWGWAVPSSAKLLLLTIAVYWVRYLIKLSAY